MASMCLALLILLLCLALVERTMLINEPIIRILVFLYGGGFIMEDAS